MSQIDPRRAFAEWRSVFDPRALLTSWGVLVFLAGILPVYFLSRSGFASWLSEGDLFRLQIGQLGINVGALLAGFLIGFGLLFLIHLARRYPDVVCAIVALIALYLILRPFTGGGFAVVSGAIGGLTGLGLAWRLFFSKPFAADTTFGSARWARFDDIEKAGMLRPDGFWLGTFDRPAKAKRGDRGTSPEVLRYKGDRHLLSVAPTRGGKGVAAVIPNLLTYPGSVIVIDPKGENALTTAVARHKLGTQIRIVDPWGLVAPRFNIPAAGFNPLDWLQPDDPDLVENAMIVADSLVVKNPDAKEPFWDEEAKAIIMGLCAYVATASEEEGQRHLGRVRDLLMQDDEGMRELYEKMYQSPIPAVAGTGARCLQKDAKLLANVLSNAQSHTHFLDSPRLRESLSESDFQFDELKTGKLSVFLILPADRLDTFGRWLRLLIQQAITVNARNIEVRPEHPILFMLDEMAALGRLTMVEQAYGLMAGFGMQMWGIVQDLSQLERIYGKSWQTFVANAGVIQYFGSRDQMTAEYFSKLCGTSTVRTIGTSIANAIGSFTSSGSTTTTTSYGSAARSLILADELMTMRRDRQILLVENMPPIAAGKTIWYEDETLSSLGFNPYRARSTRSPQPTTPAR